MNKTNDTPQIVKRDGTKEPLDISKMHFVVEQACEGLTGVSASQIEMNSHIQFTNNMSSTDIKNIIKKIKHFDQTRQRFRFYICRT